MLFHHLMNDEQTVPGNISLLPECLLPDKRKIEHSKLSIPRYTNIAIFDPEFKANIWKLHEHKYCTDRRKKTNSTLARFVQQVAIVLSSTFFLEFLETKVTLDFVKFGMKQQFVVTIVQRDYCKTDNSSYFITSRTILVYKLYIYEYRVRVATLGKYWKY